MGSCEAPPDNYELIRTTKGYSKCRLRAVDESDVRTPGAKPVGAIDGGNLHGRAILATASML